MQATAERKALHKAATQLARVASACVVCTRGGYVVFAAGGDWGEIVWLSPLAAAEESGAISVATEELQAALRDAPGVSVELETSEDSSHLLVGERVIPCAPAQEVDLPTLDDPPRVSVPGEAFSRAAVAAVSAASDAESLRSSLWGRVVLDATREGTLSFVCSDNLRLAVSSIAAYTDLPLDDAPAVLAGALVAYARLPGVAKSPCVEIRSADDGRVVLWTLSACARLRVLSDPPTYPWRELLRIVQPRSWTTVRRDEMLRALSRLPHDTTELSVGGGVSFDETVRVPSVGAGEGVRNGERRTLCSASALADGLRRMRSETVDVGVGGREGDVVVVDGVEYEVGDARYIVVRGGFMSYVLAARVWAGSIVRSG